MSLQSARDGLAGCENCTMSNYVPGGKKRCRSVFPVQREGKKKIRGVSRLRNEQADLFRASERKNQMYFSRVSVTEGSHCALA